MASNPREHGEDKGFWDGGGAAHGRDSDTAGRRSGFPGRRKMNKRLGVRTDLEFPQESESRRKED